eukprot:6682313-Prymnesium_polylepis.1
MPHPRRGERSLPLCHCRRGQPIGPGDPRLQRRVHPPERRRAGLQVALHRGPRDCARCPAHVALRAVGQDARDPVGVRCALWCAKRARWPMAYGAPCGSSGRYARPAVRSGT